MAQKKCPDCGTVYSNRLASCPQCDFYRHREQTRLKSCTGVRYPCTHSCHPCYFEKIYQENKTS